jgi:hypothetical protein
MFLALSLSSTLAHGAIYVIEGLFVAGVIGSALVVLLAGIEDFTEVFEKDEPAASRPAHTTVPAHQQ